MPSLSILSVYLIPVLGRYPRSSQSLSATKLLSLPGLLQLTCRPLPLAPFPFWLCCASHALFLPHLFLVQFLQLLDETDGLPVKLIMEISFLGNYISPVFPRDIGSHILFCCRPSACILSWFVFVGFEHCLLTTFAYLDCCQWSLKSWPLQLPADYWPRMWEPIKRCQNTNVLPEHGWDPQLQCDF